MNHENQLKFILRLCFLFACRSVLIRYSLIFRTIWTKCVLSIYLMILSRSFSDNHLSCGVWLSLEVSKQFTSHMCAGGRTGLVVRASDSGSGDLGSIVGRVGVLFPWARDIYSPKVLVIPRNRWLRLNMTEKLFTGTLNRNQNKNKKHTVCAH